jgi:hypothetical protein
MVAVNEFILEQLEPQNALKVFASVFIPGDAVLGFLQKSKTSAIMWNPDWTTDPFRTKSEKAPCANRYNVSHKTGSAFQ